MPAADIDRYDNASASGDERWRRYMARFRAFVRECLPRESARRGMRESYARCAVRVMSRLPPLLAFFAMLSMLLSLRLRCHYATRCMLVYLTRAPYATMLDAAAYAAIVYGDDIFAAELASRRRCLLFR